MTIYVHHRYWQLSISRSRVHILLWIDDEEQRPQVQHKKLFTERFSCWLLLRNERPSCEQLRDGCLCRWLTLSMNSWRQLLTPLYVSKCHLLSVDIGWSFTCFVSAETFAYVAPPSCASCERDKTLISPGYDPSVILACAASCSPFYKSFSPCVSLLLIPPVLPSTCQSSIPVGSSTSSFSSKAVSRRQSESTEIAETLSSIQLQPELLASKRWMLSQNSHLEACQRQRSIEKRSESVSFSQTWSNKVTERTTWGGGGRGEEGEAI